MLPSDCFLLSEDLYRLGNSTSPRLTHVRPRDITVVQINGIDVVQSNGKGISLFTADGIKHRPVAGWVWRFKQGTYIPGDLRIIPDGKDHYVIAPLRSMPLDKYKGLLEEMAMSATREFNKK
ncbi:hypothetical protein LGM46_27810 [Burkholderia arboris]|uniref:Tse2 family ADP-ribosyltransferase toxin n=1 Tax=Burkholderia arboris TaxID=488730 RepID=UPI001CF2F571|nr:hypothetical protein [Burkholderia arboris]MCA8036779.1 hypothetical protein [Burkholderia arboris]